MPEVAVAADPGAVATLAAQFIARMIDKRSGVAFHLALSGGSTPGLLYRRLASKPLVDEIRWKKVHLWWGDERAVGPESALSNYRLARETLLVDTPIPAKNIHRVEGELGAIKAAQLYESEFKEVIGQGRDLDLVLLGIGSDGHTASIFPDASGEAADGEVVATSRGGDPPVDRVTLTLDTINSAAEVVMLAVGEAKAPVVERVLMGDMALPAARVKPRAGEEHLHMFLDREAAASFDRTGG